MASEHDRLSAETSEAFDAKISRRIGELKSVAAALKAWESAQDALRELEELLRDSKTDPELRELAAEDLASTVSQLNALSRNCSSHGSWNNRSPRRNWQNSSIYTRAT